jgi:acyl transferase domain-containing protein
LISSTFRSIFSGGVDLCGSAEALYIKTRRETMSTSEEPTISMDKSADGFFVGEGCGALVLRRLEDCDVEAQQRGPAERRSSTLNEDAASGDKIYCTIDGIGSSDTVGGASREALASASVRPGDVDLVEMSSDGDARLDGEELLGLTQEYGSSGSSGGGSKKKKTVAIGSSKATVGHVGYASGAASLIKAALCLHNRFLPELPSWTGPRDEHVSTWDGSSFYVCPDSRAWVKNGGETRHVGVSGVAVDGNSKYHVVMSDVERTHEHQNNISLGKNAGGGRGKLLIVRGDTVEQLSANIQVRNFS